MKHLAFHLLFVGLLATPGLARADAAPPLDPYEVCEGKTKGAACDDGYFEGACIEKACPNDANATCLYCEDSATATSTGPGESTGPSTSTGTGAGTGASTSAAGDDTVTPTEDAATTQSGSSSSAGSSTTKPDDSSAKGCDVRGGDGGPVLALVGLALMTRRRRTR